MDWLLVLGLEEGLVECATLCVKSWVILTVLASVHISICYTSESSTKHYTVIYVGVSRNCSSKISTFLRSFASYKLKSTSLFRWHNSLGSCTLGASIQAW